MSNKGSLSVLKRARARRLRAEMTPAEAKLWARLKDIETPGTHFRRQVPIGPCIADFACLGARLVVEVDGEQHGRNPHRPSDQRRDHFLEGEGYRVLRFWNGDILREIGSVLDTIYAALHGATNAEPALLGRRDRVTRFPHAPSSPLRGEVAGSSDSEGRREGGRRPRLRAPSEKAADSAHPTPRLRRERYSRGAPQGECGAQGAPADLRSRPRDQGAGAKREVEWHR
ncbi:endonuclease domain-containing protein [Afifella pfennigii]|uniref:endonuclease domain-containing protein n=1 Tax=Afifella pfennigii TaxID=209897 RepID=UPI000A038B6F